MTLLRHFIAAALLVTPAVASAQDAAKLGQKQKMWMAANFRTGLTCSATPGGSAVSFTGEASFDASGDGGVDVSVASSSGGLPIVTAVAINTKGTGADKNRAAVSPCPAADASSSSSAAACSVSGDEQSPTVSATVPLSALGDATTAKLYVGTVTIVKRAAGGPLLGMWLSKKGYDYYQAQSAMSSAAASVKNPDLMVIATCDSSKVIAKGGKPTSASYDLVMGKK